MRKLSIAAAAASATLIAGPAGAAELLGGVYVHDADDHLAATCCYEHGADIQFGLRSGPLGFVSRFGDFRAYAVGSVNTDGGVDFGAAGVAWRLHIGQRFYVQPGIGGAVQDGSTLKYQADPDHLYLGSRVLFEPELSLGWRLTDRVSAEASYVHLSHAQLAGRQNPGLDDLGLRLAYRFGR